MNANLCRLTAALAVLMFLMTGCAATGGDRNREKPIEAVHIARMYGLDWFDRVAAIRFTAEMEIGARHVKRAWVWELSTDKVIFKGEDVKGKSRESVFTRNQPESSGYDPQLNTWFAEDVFQLLFPFHLAWDPAIIEAEGFAPLPIPPGEARRLTAAYGKNDALHPDQRFEIYFDGNYMIRQWVQRKEKEKYPLRTTVWKENAKVGPIRISLLRESPDATYRLRFSDVAVKRVDSDLWLPALIY